MNPMFHLVTHPFVQHYLSQLRDENCPSSQFRSLLGRIALLMAHDVFKDVPLAKKKIKTPLTEMDAPVLADQPPTIVPVLRAGLGMAEPLMDLFPDSNMGHIGVYRDHETKQAIEYLVRLPANVGQMYVLVDPMLATGNSLVHACNVLNKNGIDDKHIRVMALVAAPEGVKAFSMAHPTVPVFAAALDSHLNDKAYIVPGLGDAGDRVFGTT